MAYDFDDSASHKIDYGDVTFMDGATKVSGHIWVNLDDFFVDHYLFAKHGDSNDGLLFLYDNTGGVSGRTDTFTIFVETGSTTIRVEGATNAATTGSWQSVGFSWDADVSGVMNLWVGGTKDANSGVDSSGLAGFTNISDVLMVGARSNDTSHMDGQIAGPAIWVGGILSDDNFVSLSKNYSPKLIRPDLLAWHPPLIRNANDVVGGITGTITGATVSVHPRIFRPSAQILQFPSAGVTAALTGTSEDGLTETELVDGTETIIITLTNDTFKAAGTGPIGSTADTQALIDGFSAATSPTNGWNNEIRDKALTSAIARTSNNVATWTLGAASAFDISSDEVVTGIIPTDVLVTGAGAITATPTIGITADVVAGARAGALMIMGVG